MVSLGYLAAATSTIRLGVAVVNHPFQPPLLLAKQLATLDLLSEAETADSAVEGATNAAPPVEAQIEGAVLPSSGGKSESLHAQRHTAVIAALACASGVAETVRISPVN